MTNLATEFFPPESGPLARLTKPVAVLRLNPEELSQRIGIRFQAAHDDLDMLDWARVIGLSGRPYALVHHRHSPDPGTQIVVPFDSSDLWQDVLDVLKGLNLSQKDLAWTSPEAVARTRSSDRREGTSAVGHGRERNTTGRLRLKVPPTVTTRLRNVHGRGRFHALLRRFEKRVKGTELVVTPHEVEELLGYSAEFGTSPSKASVSPRKSSRKTARKK